MSGHGNAGNHYSRQVQHLEAVLTSKLKQLSLLQKENWLLQHKETALRSAIEGIAGPLKLVKEALSQSEGAPTASPPQHAGDAITCYESGSEGARPQLHTPSQSSDTGGACAGVDRSGHSATSRLPAAASYKGGPALLERLDGREMMVQHTMQQMGCCDGTGYKQLYTTQLLRTAVADPVCMAGYLNMPKPERLEYWCRAHNQMALLLGKYDADMRLASGSARQLLDELVDALFERVTVCALLDPPTTYMQCFMFNVETHEFEAYPKGWWSQVTQGME